MRKALAKILSSAPDHYLHGVAGGGALQVVRTLWEHSKHALRPDPSRDCDLHLIKALDRDGIVLIPDFFSASDFQSILEEYRIAHSGVENVWVRENTSFGLSNWSVTILPGDEIFTVTNQVFRNNARILELVGHIGHRRVDYFPSSVSILNQALAPGASSTTDGVSFLHADVHYPTCKVVLYLNDVSDGGAPFVYCYGSHRLSPSRLALEYELARRRKSPQQYGSEVVNGYPVVTDDMVKRYGLDPRPIFAPANTLIVANHFGLHSRGLFEPGRSRATLRASFRFIESPRYKLRWLFNRIRPPYYGFDQALKC